MNATIKTSILLVLALMLMVAAPVIGFAGMAQGTQESLTAGFGMALVCVALAIAAGIAADHVQTEF